MTPRHGAELPQLELDCLAALWSLGPSAVAQVHARLAQRGRALAYTTVLTVLDRLRRKQVVERRKQGRAFIYAPLVSREQMRARAVHRLIANYYDSPQQLADELTVAAPPPRPRVPAPPPPPVRLPEPDPEPALLD